MEFLSYNLPSDNDCLDKLCIPAVPSNANTIVNLVDRDT